MNGLKFAGFGDDAKRTGLPVKDAAARLLRFAYMEKRTMFYGAAQMVPTPNRELKTFLGRLQYYAAERSNLLRNRLRQLRVPKIRIEAIPDTSLAVLMDEAMHSYGDTEIAGTALWLHQSLLESYRKYLSETNPLADSPTCDAMESFLPRLRQMVDWLKIYLKQNRREGDQFERLETFLDAAGALDGTKARPAQERPRQRSKEAFVIPRSPGRGTGIPRVWDYVKPRRTSVDEYLAYMIGIRLSEINVAEGLSIVLCETPKMSWEFYHDISRHLWDEVRHSVMGEAAATVTFGSLEKIPMRDYESVYCMESEPLEQYATLGLEIEGAQMKYPVGKRGEWEFCKDAANNVLMTTFQDYDWADEVLHVNIARRQLTDWFPNGLQELSTYAEKGKANRAEVKARKEPVRLSEIMREANEESESRIQKSEV